MIKTRVKLIVHSKEQSIRLQVLMMQNKVHWRYGKNCVVNYKKFPIFIFVYDEFMAVEKPEPTENDKVYSIDLEYFNNHKNEEFDIDFYLATKGTCQQTEGTLQCLKNM